MRLKGLRGDLLVRTTQNRASTSCSLHNIRDLVVTVISTGNSDRKENGEDPPVEWRCGYEWSSLYPIEDIKLMVLVVDGWKYDE